MRAVCLLQPCMSQEKIQQATFTKAKTLSTSFLLLFNRCCWQCRVQEWLIFSSCVAIYSIVSCSSGGISIDNWIYLLLWRLLVGLLYVDWLYKVSDWISSSSISWIVNWQSVDLLLLVAKAILILFATATAAANAAYTANASTEAAHT